jgi:cell division protein FtsB
MTKDEIKKMVNTCNNYHSCALCPYNPEDISRFIGDRWKGGCPDYDRKLVYAMGKGYGNVSEYEAEREMLGSQIKVLKQRLNDKYIEIDNLNRDYRNAFERLKSQQREIERLKAENETYCKQINQAYDTGYDDGYKSCQDDIKKADELLKEYE